LKPKRPARRLFPTLEPRSISFKGAVQTLEAFQPVIALPGEEGAEFRRLVYEQLLKAIASHRVADRPDRYEPRRRKRRPKSYDRLMKPRHEAKRQMLNGIGENQVPFVRHPEAFSAITERKRIVRGVRSMSLHRVVSTERLAPRTEGRNGPKLLRLAVITPPRFSSLSSTPAIWLVLQARPWQKIREQGDSNCEGRISCRQALASTDGNLYSQKY
jgi:hypothetical protein